MEIGHKIKELREKHKLSQAELGALIGKSQQQIAEYESGHSDISMNTLKKISSSLQTPMYNFFTEGEKCIQNNYDNTSNSRQVNLTVVLRDDKDFQELKSFVENIV